MCAGGRRRGGSGGWVGEVEWGGVAWVGGCGVERRGMGGRGGRGVGVRGGEGGREEGRRGWCVVVVVVVVVVGGGGGGGGCRNTPHRVRYRCREISFSAFRRVPTFAIPHIVTRLATRCANRIPSSAQEHFSTLAGSTQDHPTDSHATHHDDAALRLDAKQSPPNKPRN